MSARVLRRSQERGRVVRAAHRAGGAPSGACRAPRLRERSRGVDADRFGRGGRAGRPAPQPRLRDRRSRRGSGPLRQGPPLRRGPVAHPALPRVRGRRAGRGRRRGGHALGADRHDDLLRPALPPALPRARASRGGDPRRAGRVHPGHRRGPLARAEPRPGDRERRVGGGSLRGGRRAGRGRRLWSFPRRLAVGRGPRRRRFGRGVHRHHGGCR